MHLLSTLTALWCEDQTALPQPRLHQLQVINSDVTRLMLRLKRAASMVDPAPPDEA